MKHFPTVLALLTLLILGGCTGTQEAALPTLLIVGSVQPGGAQLQLLEDVRDPLATPPRSLVPVTGSSRPLPAPPVSLDVVERNGSRSELVVLVRDDSLDITELHFFDLSDLDTGDPNFFAQSRTPIDVASILPVEVTEGLPVCLTQVQVGPGTATGPGRYAALLDSCTGAGIAEVHVIDLQEEEHLFSLANEFTGVRPLPAGIHVDQERDLLFFASADFGETAVWSTPLTGDTVPQLVGNADLDLETADRADLAPASNGIALLADDLLALVPFDAGGDTPPGPATTLTAGESILPDPLGNLETLVVLSRSAVAIHDGPLNGDPEEFSLTAPLAGATLEPVERFAYLLEEGGIEILDLFPYAEPPADRLLFREVAGLDDPRVISWAFASQGAATTP
ncbi:MAG: hypothetical protein WD273_11310 [Trueperaceae bacterium]